ncbi:hypothetical protein BJ875DRAFT_490980 [Amylocarpus encephaloides]|uniref:C2H2-type domain-containing protein n=1 Tax=Amylocarpus encephaloides TaxID=45428 RepID=A0A9P8BZ79_9HELO|nr:hypothetical protein BJ875DRAFT_490980 [Amylocarpus encephaloides]
MPSYEYTRGSTAATERAWNGHAYGCYICPREFRSLPAMNQHMQSLTHEQNMYGCPKRGCGGRYKLLSGLIQHVESERCRFMQFGKVQYRTALVASKRNTSVINGHAIKQY